jgi:uncharacterized protein
MRKPLTTLFLIILTMPQAAFSDDWPSDPFLVVEGEARIEVPPELATIELHVVAFEKESHMAVATVQQQVTRVLEVLKKYNVPDDAITSYSMQKDVERAQQADYRDLEILGYYISRRIEADLPDISQFSEIIAALAGLDNVSHVDAKFDVKNRENIEAELTRQAAKDARRKAQNMAEAMDVSLGDVHAISETEFRSDGTIYGLGERIYASMASRSPYEGTVFLPAAITIRQSLNVVFSIEQ